MNKFFGIGRLTSNPTKYATQNGNIVVKFSIAIDRYSKEEKKTDFINITAFKYNADNILKYCSKGSLVVVEGRIQTGSYPDTNSHKTIYTTDIIVENITFLDKKKEEDINKSNSSIVRDVMEEDPFKSFSEDQLEITEDDLPF